MKDENSVNVEDQTENLSDIDNMSDEDYAKAFDQEVEQIEQPQVAQSNEPEVAPDVVVQQEPQLTGQEEPLVNDSNNNPDVTNQTNEEQTPFVSPTKEEIQAILGGSIKAKGRDINIESYDELKKYLELGAAYYDDREKVKPYISIAKTFEKQGIKTQDDINFLIDLANGDKKAIAKLVKDKEIELSDIDDTIESKELYKANDYTINEQELEIERTLKNIENDESYDKTIDVLSSVDNKSKQFISENPNFIEVINTHIGNGVYDIIQNEMYKMKSLGKLPLEGGSEIDNYIEVGKLLFEKRQDVNEPQGNNSSSTNNVFSSNNEIQPEQKQVDQGDVNIGALTDEEFMKKYGHL